MKSVMSSMGAWAFYHLGNALFRSSEFLYLVSLKIDQWGGEEHVWPEERVDNLDDEDYW